MRTLTTTLCALTLLSATVSTQNETTAARLSRAQLIEEQEGDLAAAERAYRALLADEAASDVHARTAYRLGAMLWRLGRRDEAGPLLDRAAASGDDLARLVAAVKAEDGEAAREASRQQARGTALVERYIELLRADPKKVQGQVEIVRDEMASLAEPSARAIADWLRTNQWQRRTAAEKQRESFESIARELVQRLWLLGSEPAAAYLTSVATGNDLDWQRFVTQRGTGVTGSAHAPELWPVLRAFTRVADPTRECWANVVRMLKAISPEPAIECIVDAHPETAVAGTTALRRFFEKNASWTTRFFEQHGDRIVAQASSARERDRDAAWQLLLQAGRNDVDGSLPPLLRALRVAPERAPAPGSNFGWRQPDDEALRSIAATAEALGPIAESGPSNAQMVVALLLRTSNNGWTRAAWPSIATLLRLGYAGHTNDPWLAMSYGLCGPDARATIIRHLAEVREWTILISNMRSRSAPRQLFPAIRDVVADCADPERQVAWAPKVGDPTTNSGGSLSGLLLQMAGRSGHPDAAAWLNEQIRLWPSELESIAYSLLLLSRSGEDATAGLRQLLTIERPRAISESWRAQVLFELIRIGDDATIELLPKAWQLGLAPTQYVNHQYSVLSEPGNEDGIADRFLAASSVHRRSTPILLLAPTTADEQPFWRGYDEGQATRAWRLLLEGPTANSFWQVLAARVGGQPNPIMPTGALPLLAEMLPSRLAGMAKNSGLLQAIPEALGRVTPETFADSASLPATIRKLLDLDERLATNCFDALAPSIAAQFADDVRDKLRQTGSTAWLRALTAKKLDAGVDAWRAALRGSSAWGTLSMLPPDAPEALRPDVIAQLQHATSGVRVTACEAMARAYPQQAPAAILPLLRDPEEKVRQAAREQLDLLREAQEQRQFWARVSGGVDLSPQATSQKLVQQAMPANDAAQRVLAIRSLAAVGATEALPLLITWSQDADAPADVRAAAGKAITSILARTESGK